MREFLNLFLNDADWFIGTLLIAPLVVMLIYMLFKLVKSTVKH